MWSKIGHLLHKAWWWDALFVLRTLAWYIKNPIHNISNSQQKDVCIVIYKCRGFTMFYSILRIKKYVGICFLMWPVYNKHWFFHEITFEKILDHKLRILWHAIAMGGTFKFLVHYIGILSILICSKGQTVMLMR